MCSQRHFEQFLRDSVGNLFLNRRALTNADDFIIHRGFNLFPSSLFLRFPSAKVLLSLPVLIGASVFLEVAL